MTKSSHQSRVQGRDQPSSRPTRKAKFTGVYLDKKQYQMIGNSQRTRFIDLIATKRWKICDAARECAIPYENAKVIYQVYVKEGRVQRRYKLQEDNGVNDANLSSNDTEVPRSSGLRRNSDSGLEPRNENNN